MEQTRDEWILRALLRPSLPPPTLGTCRPLLLPTHEFTDQSIDQSISLAAAVRASKLCSSAHDGPPANQTSKANKQASAIRRNL